MQFQFVCQAEYWGIIYLLINFAKICQNAEKPVNNQNTGEIL